jgi:hypothetical protein
VSECARQDQRPFRIYQPYSNWRRLARTWAPSITWLIRPRRWSRRNNRVAGYTISRKASHWSVVQVSLLAATAPSREQKRAARNNPILTLSGSDMFLPPIPLKDYFNLVAARPHQTTPEHLLRLSKNTNSVVISTPNIQHMPPPSRRSAVKLGNSRLVFALSIRPKSEASGKCSRWGTHRGRMPACPKGQHN